MKRPPRKRSRCSCGEAWVVKKKVLKDGTVVEGYYCSLCDGRAYGDKERPR